MEPLVIILALVVGAVLGFFAGRALSGGGGSAAEAAAEAEAKKIVEAARDESAELKKAAEIEGKELAFKRKAEVDEELRERRAKLAQEEDAVAQREQQLGKRNKELERAARDLDNRETSVEDRERSADTLVAKADETHAAAQARLEEVAGLTSEQARRRLEDELRDEVRTAVAGDIKRIEDEANEQATLRSKTIIATAIQRFASEFVHERTVSVVNLPSDDMKGRLIGREGRNVRALEAATGTDIIIDDSPEVITVSCFNPVRREVARIAISNLVADGRIHPTRIEEVVHKAEKEVAKACQEAGEQAVFDLGLHRVHPELIRQLGGLKFRLSYAQNVLQHSIEVGYIAGLIAAELGVSVKSARRAGLLHDIGKAVDHEQEGSHAEVGAALAKKHRESPKICQAIASHHGAPEPSALLDHIVYAANQLSNARPGARREQLAGYIKRLEDIEKVCTSYDTVTRAYAILAGREVRVMVENDKVDDAGALLLSKDIARRLESEATYAGQVKVVVLRETRASEYAN